MLSWTDESVPCSQQEPVHIADVCVRVGGERGPRGGGLSRVCLLEISRLVRREVSYVRMEYTRDKCKDNGVGVQKSSGGEMGANVEGFPMTGNLCIMRQMSRSENSSWTYRST